MDDVTGEEFDKMFGGLSKEILRKAFGDDVDKLTIDDIINFARERMKEQAIDIGNGLAILADVAVGQLVLVFPEKVDSIRIDAVDIPLVMPMLAGTAKWLLDRLMQIHAGNLDPVGLSDFMAMLKAKRIERGKQDAKDRPEEPDGD